MIANDIRFSLSACAGNLAANTSRSSMSSSKSCVDHICWCTRVCRPLTVVPDFGRCLFTNFSVRPGHVKKKPCLIAATHDFGAGQNVAA
eukprot:6837627-Ditylum_brightwellii.AAC.1